MKKLLLGALTALAFLFGFASCSGDLHNDYIKPWYIEGDIAGTRTEMTVDNDTGFMTFQFTYDSGMTAWGGSNGTVFFKPMISSSGWLDDFGGNEAIITLPINDKDDAGNDKFTSLTSREDGPDAGPANLSITGLAEGETYTIYVNGNAAANTASILVKGADAVVYPDMFVLSGASLTKMNHEGGGVYALTVKATESTYDFKVFDGTNTYGAKKTDASTTLNTKVSLLSTEDAEIISVKDLEKGEYAITVDFSDEEEPSVTVGSAYKAFIVGDFKADNEFIGIPNFNGSETVLAYTFTYSADMTAWGGKDGAINFVVTTKSGDWNSKIVKDVALSFGADYAASGSGDGNATAKGLVAGKDYTILIDISSASKAKSKIISGVPLYIAGDMNGWSFGIMDNDENGSYFKFTEAVESQGFKVKTVDNWDSDNDTVFATATVSGSTPVDTGDTSNAGDNATVTANAGDKLYVVYNSDLKVYQAWVSSN